MEAQKKHSTEKREFSFKILLTGMTFGWISRSLTNPLERLKMLKQVNVREYKNRTMTQSFTFMWRREGLYGFFKGNGANVARMFPKYAFEFTFYELFKKNLFSGRDDCTAIGLK